MQPYFWQETYANHLNMFSSVVLRKELEKRNPIEFCQSVIEIWHESSIDAQKNDLQPYATLFLAGNICESFEHVF